MSKPKPPIEENVDLEFEYKLLHFYDRIKPYLKQIIFLILIVLAGIFYYIYHKSKIEEKLNQASVYVYKIQTEIQNKEYDKALKDIKFFKANFADTSYVKLIYSFEVFIQKEKRNIDKNLVSKLKNKLNTDQIKAYFTEFEGYISYKNNKFDDAVSKLNMIKQEHFNYLSSLTLKGIILKKEGKNQQAKQLFEEIKELSKDKYNYFEAFAKESI